MDIVIKVLQFILSFSLLVIIHEFGHFFFARLFGTRVEKFYLFFNPWFSLFKFKKGETTYGVGWIPFGGYVKIAGMIDESMDTEQMKQPVQPWEFRAKPAWQRLLIMVGGVVMNIVLAVCIYIGISYTWGDNYIASKDVKYGYVFNDVAKEIGLRDGDKIIDVAGEPGRRLRQDSPNDDFRPGPVRHRRTRRYGHAYRHSRNGYGQDTGYQKLHGYPRTLRNRPGRERRRRGESRTAAGRHADRFQRCGYALFRRIPASLFRTQRGAGQPRDRTRLGGVTKIITVPVEISNEGLIEAKLVPINELIPISTHRYSFLESIPHGIKLTGTEISSYAKQIKLLFSPKTEAYKSLGGIMTLGSVFPTYWSWEAFWHITAFFSIVLAIMNILPIPGLDGGHVLFLLVEVITRRKPSDKFMERATTVGFILILALLIFANGNDIYRFFIK